MSFVSCGLLFLRDSATSRRTAVSGSAMSFLANGMMSMSILLRALYATRRVSGEGSVRSSSQAFIPSFPRWGRSQMARAAMYLLGFFRRSLIAVSAPGLFSFSLRKPRYLTLTAGLESAVICPSIVLRSNLGFVGLNPFWAMR